MSQSLSTIRDVKERIGMDKRVKMTNEVPNVTCKNQIQ